MGRARCRIVGLVALLIVAGRGAAAGPAGCAEAVILRGGAQAGGKTSFQRVANTAINQLGPSADLSQGAMHSVCACCAACLCRLHACLSRPGASSRVPIRLLRAPRSRQG